MSHGSFYERNETLSQNVLRGQNIVDDRQRAGMDVENNTNATLLGRPQMRMDCP